MNRFLTSAEVLVIHDQVIERWGGSHGIRDIALLESALAAPRQTFRGELLHPDVFSQTAAVLRSLALDHPFIDGNKRTAFLSAVVFLEMSAWELQLPEDEAISFMVGLATSKPGVEMISPWLKKHGVRRSRRSDDIRR